MSTSACSTPTGSARWRRPRPVARPRVHLKIDTGLHRLGALPETVDSLADALREAGDRVEVAGIFTHFADAGEDLGFTVTQHARFLEAVEALRAVAPDALLHTSGQRRDPGASGDAPRPGARRHRVLRLPAGARPGVAPAGDERLLPCRAGAHGRAGESVGYGRTWRAETARRIATATLGYGQGLPRALSNRGHLAIRGRRCPIVGIVSMDQVGVDVSDVDGVAAGDTAMFIGERDGVRIGADEVGELDRHAAARDSVRHLGGHPAPSWGHACCATVRV